MPEVDGYEATTEIRREESDGLSTPVIAMTATAMQGDREKALEARMDDYVSKPVKVKELDVVLERWLLYDEEKVEQDTTAPGAGNGTAAPNGSIDQSVLEGLRELQEEGEPDILKELIELFLADVPPQLKALREAEEREDAQSVERIAHTLKESSSHRGAIRMAAICAELEEIGRSGDLAPAPALISRLEAELGRAHTVLERELPKS